MNQIPRLSEAVYVGMCLHVGTPTEVRIRREVMDTKEVLNRPVYIMRGFDRMLSGSYREGFRLGTSDIDWMVWHPDHKVICDLSQISLYSTPQHTVILMECENLPPGFTRLMMLTPSNDQKVVSSCITINGEIYISSSLFRVKFLNFLQSSSFVYRSSVQHGPCATHEYMGEETDCAFCFQSNHWPNVALSWIQRCQRKQWPPHGVLFAIIKEGCHVVPISSEPLNPERDTEWRISFSGAEQKLVYSMNHCQFLCYGLLKIFLKEVINAEKNDTSLCSYFMKTTVFWVIQYDSLMEWTPCNLLTCFWTCFKLLISWVYKGECPNFFIPQNNMFRVKVVGQRQAALFDQLYALYCKGIPCLLSSPTIGKFLSMTILNRMLTFSTDECTITSDVYLDNCMFNNFKILGSIVENKEEFVRTIIAVEHLLKSQLTSFQAVTVQYHLSGFLKHFSCLMLNEIMATLSNKTRMNIISQSLNMMKAALKIGCVSDILYLAMYYYRICQYEQSLRCLYKAQERMSKPYIIYNYHVNQEVYRCATEGMSLSEKMRKCLIEDISFEKTFLYIDELVPEQEATTAGCPGCFSIPPLVMLHFLFVLNHHRLGDTVRSEQSLQDLHTLLLYDNYRFVKMYSKEISWQVLGICQQTCGDYVGALNSFQCSLQQVPHFCIQRATVYRMQNNRLLQRCSVNEI